MKILKTLISLATASVMINSPFFADGAVTSLAITDNVSQSNSADIKNIHDSDIAIGESNAVRGDNNGDGKVDILDLPIMKRSQVSSQTHTATTITNILTGQWKTEGTIGVRDFTFDNGTGTFFMEDTGFQQDFTYTVQGVSFIMNIPYTLPLTAIMTWTDSSHFSLKWNDGTIEHFTSVSNNSAVQNNTQQNTVEQQNTQHSISNSQYSSSTGQHTIQNINGVTYIDGILIANKTYSLPANYNPGGLLPEVESAFLEMARCAWNDGISLWICSGFRSYEYQKTLYNGYISMYGKDATDTFSARPGHSEHQTGMAMDIIEASSAFEGTPAAIWLAENCWKYGFIIRYPKGKESITGYKYEPWHIRYLGKETAKAVYDSGLTLEEYLGINSVYSY